VYNSVEANAVILDNS